MEPDAIVIDGQTPLLTDPATQTPLPPSGDPTGQPPLPSEPTPVPISAPDTPPPPPVSDPIADPIATTTVTPTEVVAEDDAALDAEDVKDIFDPQYYLQANPDIAAQAPSTNVEAFALKHFLDFGQYEQRAISLAFDAKVYSEFNVDIKITYEASFSSSVKFSPLGHYLKYGLKEKRKASFFWSVDSYLESNQDVAAGAGDDEVGEFALRHFATFGKKEQRKFKIAGKLEFDGEFYLKKYEEARLAVESGEYESAYDHYQSVGIFKNFTPTPAFDPQLYFDLNEDVASQFKLSGSAIFGAFFHFLNFGLEEDRDATLPEDEFTTTPTPESDKIVGNADGNVFYALAGDDTVLGYGGADTVTGGEGKDVIFGGDGNDVLVGGAGNDYINGEEGDDVLLGEDGDDILEGSSGEDGMWGGSGKDVFSFGSLPEEEEGTADDDADDDDTVTGGTDGSGDDASGDTLTGGTTTTTTSTSELSINASSSTTTTTTSPTPRDADDDDDDDDDDGDDDGEGSTDVDTVSGGTVTDDVPTDGDDSLGGGDGTEDPDSGVDLLTGMSTIYDFEVGNDKISVSPTFGFESGDELLDAIADSGTDTNGNLYSILDLSADFSIFIYHDAELLASNFDILGAATDDGTDGGTDSGLGGVDGGGGTTVETPLEPPSGLPFPGLPPGLARQIASGKRTEETLPPGISKRF